MQVDPQILTVKAIVAVFLAAQVATHVWVWSKLPQPMRCDGFYDRIVLSLITLIASAAALAALAGLYWFIFTW